MFKRIDSDDMTQSQEQPDALHGSAPHGAASRGLAAIFGLDGRHRDPRHHRRPPCLRHRYHQLRDLASTRVFRRRLGFIVYRIQRGNYGDTHDAALTKALIVGLLTAIPVPLTPVVAAPGGLLGIVQAIRRRNRLRPCSFRQVCYAHEPKPCCPIRTRGFLYNCGFS